jgi:hypothetical protein
LTAEAVPMEEINTIMAKRETNRVLKFAFFMCFPPVPVSKSSVWDKISSSDITILPLEADCFNLENLMIYHTNLLWMEENGKIIRNEKSL